MGRGVEDQENGMEKALYYEEGQEGQESKKRQKPSCPSCLFFPFSLLSRILPPMGKILSLMVPVALAQPASIDPPASCIPFFGNSPVPPGAGLGFYCIADYIANLTYVVIGFSASLSLIMLMINGYRYMIGPAIPGGSSDAAKKGITMALVGLAVSLLTYIILDTLVSAVTL